MLAEAVGALCLTWYIVVVVVCAIGYVQIQRYYSNVPHEVSILLQDVTPPRVTIIRPVKGLEPRLYECLAATLRQTYPKDSLTIYFCIASRDDPALPTLQRLLDDFPGFDATILVEEEDPALPERDGQGSKLGPNPKIRNMSRAYREAKSDIVWIIDCNVWVARGVAGRMVSTLCGYGTTGQQRKNKFVHQLPIVVDIATESSPAATQGLWHKGTDKGQELHVSSSSTTSFSVHCSGNGQVPKQGISACGGGRLEELFMSSSHAKFYTAINTVLLAPCIIGKSTMFRRSHLNHLASSSPDRASGIDFFSDYICEDHLIGDLLWKEKVPEEKDGEMWGNHAMVFGDLAIQPMAGMSVKEYVARRLRWLRVRKFTVRLATLVEPGTESFLCSLYGAFAVTTLPWFNNTFRIPQTWTAFTIFWLVSVLLWAIFDWTLYLKLHSAASVEMDDDTPDFVRPPTSGRRRGFMEWLAAWLGREALAFPIWAWAVFGGVTVVWRGKRLWVGMDMRVHELEEDSAAQQLLSNGDMRQESGKARKK